MNRYAPNPRLIAPSTEQRMVPDDDGEYVLVQDVIEYLKRKIANNALPEDEPQ